MDGDPLIQDGMCVYISIHISQPTFCIVHEYPNSSNDTNEYGK